VLHTEHDSLPGTTTEIKDVAVAVPQPVVIVYDTVAEPVVIPVTTPEASIDAFVPLMLHEPPGSVSESVIVEPVFTIVAPVITPADGPVDTVTTVVVRQPLAV
jgi:hypothetical protein